MKKKRGNRGPVKEKEEMAYRENPSARCDKSPPTKLFKDIAVIPILVSESIMSMEKDI